MPTKYKLPTWSTSEYALGLSGRNIIVIAVAIGLMIVIAQWMRRRTRRAIQRAAEIKYGGSLWVDEEGNPRIQQGWYPTPDNKWDRYYSEGVWTEHYKKHTDESKLDDPSPL